MVYKLVSSEGTAFNIDTEAACMSGFVSQLIEDGATEEIPILNVDAAILSKVVDFCNYHKGAHPPAVARPLKSVKLDECGVSAWDCKFLAMPREELYKVVIAANYLDIRSLLDLSCAKVASYIKDKTPDEVRRDFGLPPEPREDCPKPGKMTKFQD
jgi:S-phase kinase-associated protein 1